MELEPCSSTSSDLHPQSSFDPHSSSSPHSVGDSHSPPFKPHYQAHSSSNSHYSSSAGSYGLDDICDSSMHTSSTSSNSRSFDLCPSSIQQKQPQPQHHMSSYQPGSVFERKWSQCSSQDSMDDSLGSNTPQHSPPYPAPTSSMQSFSSKSPYPSPEGPTSSSMTAPVQKRFKMEELSQHESSQYYMEPVPSFQMHSVNESITASPEYLSPEIKAEPLTGNEEYSIPLSPYIKDKLNQLHTVYNEIFEAPYAPEQVPKFTDSPKTADEVFNMTDIFIRRLIRFAKNLPEFKNLAQSDQIQLLKVSCLFVPLVGMTPIL